MKVKVFNYYGLKTYSDLEKEINDFLSGFYKIESINFTYLRDNTILCSYEGETWEEHDIKMEKGCWSRISLDQTIGSYQ